MKLFFIAAFMLSSNLGWAQAVPDDIFLEADPMQSAAPPVEDLPPDEPPYTKTADELEAQKLIDQESAKAKKANSNSSKNPDKMRTNPKAEATASSVITDENGKQKMAHPDAKRGLYQIDQNTGRYYYKTTKLSHKNQSTSIRFGKIAPPEISSEVGGIKHKFSDIYGQDTLPYLILDYEWQPFRSFGKLGLIMGMGFFTASGHGRFANSDVKGGAAAKEGFTFIGLPISAGVIYRLEFSDKQWLAPFLTGGLSYYGLGEIRDDGKPPKIVGTPAGYGGGGILFNITTWSKEVDFTLDREYGINNMWFVAELRVIQSLNKDLDISSNVVNLGIAVDY